MSKILIEVYVPAAEKTYDVFLPKEAMVYEILPMISSVMSELEKGFFMAAEDSVLCYYGSGEVLDLKKSVNELNLKNGSRLIII